MISLKRTLFYFVVVTVEILLNINFCKLEYVQEHGESDSMDKGMEIFNIPLPIIKNYEPISLSKEDKNDDEDLKYILEEKYKFKKEDFSTRYKVEPKGRNFYNNDKHIAWAFRAFAGRRIVGGMETSISMYPYNVAISRNGKHWCGGSVIDEQWILTAGHCLESAFDRDVKKLNPFIVRAGSSFHNRGGYQARINKVFFHQNYTPGNADYDYSLLRLDRPMPIGRNIAVLNLPSPEYTVKEDDILVVSGWGSTDETGFGHIPNRLRFVPVPLMQTSTCQQSYRFYITPRMLCAGYATGGKDACNHDSGGPAVRDGVLLGIVSFGGKRCGDPKSPGVYSRVSEATEWVEKTITSNEAFEDPVLQKKILKARAREKELKKFKATVEEKKNKIRSWLRETLNSPHFIELAKRKLSEAGHKFRRVMNPVYNPIITPNMTDEDIDRVNLSNFINDDIVGDGQSDSDVLLNTLALQEAVSADTVTDEWLLSSSDSESISIEDVLRYEIFV